jgi:hypothetical protein
MYSKATKTNPLAVDIFATGRRIVGVVGEPGETRLLTDLPPPETSPAKARGQTRMPLQLIAFYQMQPRAASRGP